MDTSHRPELNDVFAYIDGHAQDFLARLIDYVRHPSISAYGEGIGEVAEYISSVMRQIGLSVEIIPTSGWPMVYGEYFVDSGIPTVLLYGHYDVQPPDPLEEWITPPFEPAIRDGRLYAWGVGDNKAQHFANLLALESLLVCRGTSPCNVKVLLEGEEEVGSPHMPEFVREHRDALQADLVIFSDGPVHENGQSTLCFGVRGVLDIELRAYGANRDLHSGHWGGIVPNPLWTLVHLLASMKNERGEVTIDGFYEHVLPITDKERAALAELPIDVDEVKRSLDLKYLDEPQERGYFERLAAWPTLTINGIHGGYGGPGSKTVLPHEAVAKLDIRLVEAQTAEEILAKIKAHVQRYAPEVSVSSHGGMDPSKTSLDSLYTEPIRQAMYAAQGAYPLLVPAMGASIPEYVFTKTLGIPTFGVPYANADEANHAPNENMEIWRFFSGIKTGAAMLSYLGAMPSSTLKPQSTQER
ncbi:MAG TPA: M20/M25/M40 family metallo-hydrolase [Ktedonobacteraceae bacterium]|nr:M20/M25/M40 family metallo-hydrolase [Ktedonobacteraceae bacterium]